MNEFAWLPALFPRVPVNLPNGKVIKFDMSDYVEYDTETSNSSDVNRRNFYRSDESYACTAHKLNGEVNFDELRDLERMNVPFSMAERASLSTYQSIMLKGEIEAATLATTSGTYASTSRVTLSGADQLTNATADLIGIVDDARGAIQIGCGKFPNTGVFSWEAFTAAIKLDQVVERFSATVAPAQISGIERQSEMLAAVLGLDRIVVAKSLVRNARTGVNTRIGGSGSIVLAYVPESVNADMYEPSFGYTYGLNGYPLVKPMVTDEENDKYLFPVRDEFDVAVTDANAGYLISGAV